MYPARQFEQGKAAFFWLRVLRVRREWARNRRRTPSSLALPMLPCGVHRKGDAPGYERRPKGMTHKVRTPQLLGEPEQEAARQRGLQPNARCSGGDVPENKVASDKGEAGRGVSRRKAMSAAPIGHCAPVRHVGQPSSEKLQIPRATSKAEPLQGRDGQRHQWGCHSQPSRRWPMTCWAVRPSAMLRLSGKP